ncbi:hypothetical protein JTB14_023416 [Gonioctena quinquepunctata]|nr:hypothetical protein JTB14_023416 [Gonioctena quinquepunctata]
MEPSVEKTYEEMNLVIEESTNNDSHEERKVLVGEDNQLDFGDNDYGEEEPEYGVDEYIPEKPVDFPENTRETGRQRKKKKFDDSNLNYI